MSEDVKSRDTVEPAPRSLEPESPFVSGLRGADRNFVPVPTLVDANATYIPEAPTDGRLYGRKGDDETWRPLTVFINESLEGDGDGTTGLTPLGVAPASDIAPGILSVPNTSALTLVQVATIPPSRSVNMQLGMDVASGQDVLDGTDDIHPITPAALAEALTGGWDVLDDRFVNVDGDVMTGGLTINADLFVDGHAAAPLAPTADEHLTNKLYVDSRITGTLTLIGTFNASTGQVTFSYASGIPNGPLPPADAGNLNQYVIVAVAGQPPIGPPETQIICQVGDWWVSDGTTWLYLPIGGDVIAARNVALIPPAFGEDNVQDAMEAAEAAVDQNASDIADLQTDLAAGLALKVDRAGDTMLGRLFLADDPTADLEAATKRYVDDAVAVPVPVRVPIGSAPPPGALPGALWWRDDPDGDFYILYDDGSSVQWVSTTKPGLGGGAGATPLVSIGPNPPAGAQPGALWWRNDPDGELYVRYNDGARAQWVPASRPGSGGGGAPPFDDSHLLRLTGGTVTGELLVTGPTTNPFSVVTRDWVETITSGSLLQGAWRVAANAPDITAGFPSHGDRFLCLTDDPDVAETPPRPIPGLTGRQINNGAYIIWDQGAGQWQLILNATGGLTSELADQRYLRQIGGALTGKVTSPATVAGDPATTLATKGYVDAGGGSASGAWTAVSITSGFSTTDLMARTIPGGRFEIRGSVLRTASWTVQNQVSPCATLPAGMRPTAPDRRFTVPMFLNSAFLHTLGQIQPSGVIAVSLPAGVPEGNGARFYLDNIALS